MNRPDFEDYRREYESDGIGPLLYSLLLEVVTKVSKRYPARVYSPDGEWSKGAIQSLCHDYALERLINGRRLHYFLLTQESVQGLTQILQQDYRHFLINGKARSEYSNLRARVKRILNESHDFSTLEKSDDTRFANWGLSTWGVKLVAQREDEVIEAMFATKLPPPVRYRADSEKLSPIVGNQYLTHLLKNTLAKLDKYISINLLMQGLRYRLNLLDVEIVSIDQPVAEREILATHLLAEIIPDQTMTNTLADANELANDLFERLSDRQRQILGLQQQLGNPSQVEIAKHMNVSKRTVSNESAEVARLIAAMNVEQHEAEQILEYLLERCRLLLEGIEKNET